MIVGERPMVHIMGLVAGQLIMSYVRSFDMMAVLGLLRMQHRWRMQIANRQGEYHTKMQNHPRHQPPVTIGRVETQCCRI